MPREPVQKVGALRNEVKDMERLHGRGANPMNPPQAVTSTPVQLSRNGKPFIFQKVLVVFFLEYMAPGVESQCFEDLWGPMHWGGLMGFASAALQLSPHAWYGLCKGTDVRVSGQGPRDKSHQLHEEAESIRKDPRICLLCLTPLYLQGSSAWEWLLEGASLRLLCRFVNWAARATAGGFPAPWWRLALGSTPLAKRSELLPRVLGGGWEVC